MSYKITSFSGFFYVIDKNTGKLIIEQSYRTFDDAVRAAKHWYEYLAK
jgi:hypothetical protein